MTDIQTTVKTETTHAVTVTAPEGEHFEVQTREGVMAAMSVEFKVFIDGTGTLKRVGVHWYATGFAIKADGTVGRAKRLDQGANSGRLPVLVRLCALEALSEAVGVLHDPDGQLGV